MSPDRLAGTRTIWKYELAVIDVQRVRMPENARLLHVAGQPISENTAQGARQYTALVLWAEVDPSAPIVERLIAVVGTGIPAPGPDDDAIYVGSALCDPFVWHVYDGGQNYAL